MGTSVMKAGYTYRKYTYFFLSDESYLLLSNKSYLVYYHERHDVSVVGATGFAM